MKNEVDKLKNKKRYKAKMELVGFCEEGDIMTGAYIKKYIPFDVSPHQGIKAFFEKVKKVKK